MCVCILGDIRLPLKELSIFLRLFEYSRTIPQCQTNVKTPRHMFRSGVDLRNYDETNFIKKNSKPLDCLR